MKWVRRVVVTRAGRKARTMRPMPVVSGLPFPRRLLVPSLHSEALG
jgi:hypothetical protein